MTNVLIVDDEKIEREGLKYLLSREEGERKVFEASNGIVFVLLSAPKVSVFVLPSIIIVT